MSIQNNKKNIKPNLLRKKGRKNISENILTLLDSAKFGLNYSQIAEQLDLSRNTVKKYVEALKKEDKVLIMEIGRSNICLIKRDMIDSSRDILDRVGFLANDFMISFFRAFEKIFFPLHPNLRELIKEIGREMSKTMVWPTVEISDSIDPSKDKLAYLIQIGNVCIQHFEVFNQFGKVIDAEIIPPQSNATSLVLRVKYTLDFEDTEFFYHMISGFYEQKLHENFGRNLFTKVLEIQKENSICYFETGFKDEES
ncbi:MAG: HTH domain-containing protein [Candidatus Hodarchaeota archaeon]